MERGLLDRWTDTTTFRFMLFCSGVLVLPVLVLGVLTTVIGGAALLTASAPIEIEQALFGLLSAGGVLGLIGYARARHGAKKPDRHNVTATLLCLAAGVVTALAVAGYALFGTVDGLRWGSAAWVAPTTVFAAANAAWAASGLGWMHRLPRRYAEKTGRVFDGLPVVLLGVALALATAALLTVTTL